MCLDMLHSSAIFLILSVHFPFPMDNDLVQKKCEDFLRSLGVPGFIVFGWKRGEDSEGKSEFGVVSSYHDMPKNAAMKGMTWVLNDFVSKSF